MTKNILKCQNVNKTFGKKTILKDINIEIEPGRIVGLLGKNGAGKTTLIKAINGLLQLDSGKITIAGKEIGVKTKEIISYLPERTYLEKTMKISQVIEFFEDFYENFSSKKAKQLIEDFELDLNARLNTLSKGMQEKVQIALVMSRKAKLYILDEPLGGVDPATRDYIMETILKNFDDGASMIISTHLVSDIEKILDDVVIINRGEIKLVSDAEKLRAKTKKSIDQYFREEYKNAQKIIEI